MACPLVEAQSLVLKERVPIPKANAFPYPVHPCTTSTWCHRLIQRTHPLYQLFPSAEQKGRSLPWHLKWVLEEVQIHVRLLTSRSQTNWEGQEGTCHVCYNKFPSGLHFSPSRKLQLTSGGFCRMGSHHDPMRHPWRSAVRLHVTFSIIRHCGGQKLNTHPRFPLSHPHTWASRALPKPRVNRLQSGHRRGTREQEKESTGHLPISPLWLPKGASLKCIGHRAPGKAKQSRPLNLLPQTHPGAFLEGRFLANPPPDPSRAESKILHFQKVFLILKPLKFKLGSLS